MLVGHIGYSFHGFLVLLFTIGEALTLDQCIVGLLLLFLKWWEQIGCIGIGENCVHKWFGPGQEEFTSEWTYFVGDVRSGITNAVIRKASFNGSSSIGEWKYGR